MFGGFHKRLCLRLATQCSQHLQHWDSHFQFHVECNAKMIWHSSWSNANHLFGGLRGTTAQGQPELHNQEAHNCRTSNINDIDTQHNITPTRSKTKFWVQAQVTYSILLKRLSKGCLKAIKNLSKGCPKSCQAQKLSNGYPKAAHK